MNEQYEEAPHCFLFGLSSNRTGFQPSLKSHSTHLLLREIKKLFGIRNEINRDSDPSRHFVLRFATEVSTGFVLSFEHGTSFSRIKKNQKLIFIAYCHLYGKVSQL